MNTGLHLLALLKRARHLRPSRRRAISEVIAIALLIIVVIALIGFIWLFASRLIGGGGDVALARAVVTQNTFMGGNQIVTLSVELDSRSDSPLFIRTIRINTDRGGTLTTLSVTGIVGATPTAGVLPASTTVGGVTMAFVGENYVRPRQTLEFTMTLVIPSPYITTAQVIIELVDPAGRVYTVTSNEVRLS